jgi:periplasmic copper chaperone A
VNRFALALILLASIAACSRPAPIEVKDAWTRDSIGRTANAAVFMTIRSEAPDQLIGASTTVAKKTDLMSFEGGSAMGMKYVKGIGIPADKSVRLSPSGLHIWLADLNQPLTAGQSFPLTLKFERAGERRVVVSVIKPAAAPPMSAMQM